MPSIQKFRQKMTHRDYYLSSHAEEEMWDDQLRTLQIICRFHEKAALLIINVYALTEDE